MVKNTQQKLIERLRRDEGANEETEHLIDWLQDSWATWQMLRDRFGEARAWSLYAAPILQDGSRSSRVMQATQAAQAISAEDHWPGRIRRRQEDQPMPRGRRARAHQQH